jgi:hypothetical protein
MAKKSSNPETSRLTRKAGAAPRVARKPRLAATAVDEIAAPSPPAPPPAPEPPPAPTAVAPAPEPPAAPERYTFRPVRRRPSARAFLLAVVRRARQELETRSEPVRATLRARFPWLGRLAGRLRALVG